MRARKFTLTAAAVIAAAAVSACAPTESKPWPNAASSSTAAVAKPTRWLAEVAPQPVPADQRDTSEWRLRFGSTAEPGMGVWERGTDSGCTLGPVVAPTTMSPTSRGYLLAGHCDSAVTAQTVTYSDADRSDAHPLGVYTPWTQDKPVDATTLWLQPGTAAPASIAGHPVAGVLTEAATRSPELIGQTVCVLGAVSGLVCGPLADASAQIVVDATTHEGDSGSAMFLVSNTGAATVIGILTKSEATGGSYGVIADTALQGVGAQVVTDPTAAAAARGDARYVTPS